MDFVYITRTPGDGLFSFMLLVKDKLPPAPKRQEYCSFFFAKAEKIFKLYEVPYKYKGAIISKKLSVFLNSLRNSLGENELVDYNSIKKYVLSGNAWTPLQHQINFEKCAKKLGESCCNWEYRVRTSLEYYLKSRKALSTNKIKDLIIADHMKKCLPERIKHHIRIKEGTTEWMSPRELAMEIDDYAKVNLKISSILSKMGFKKDSPMKMKLNHCFYDVGRPLKRKSETKSFLPLRCKRLRYQDNNTNKIFDTPDRKDPVSNIDIGGSALVIGSSALTKLNIRIGNQKVAAIKDSGSMLSVFHKGVIPKQYLKSLGEIYLRPAIGRSHLAKVIQIPVSLWTEGEEISPEVDVIAAVTSKLNSPAIITPQLYDVLVKEAQVNQLNACNEGAPENTLQKSFKEEQSKANSLSKAGKHSIPSTLSKGSQTEGEDMQSQETVKC